jgi:hypothetical protein
MSPYDKSEFRSSRKLQYAYFRHILQYSLLAAAGVLVFLGLMLKYAWS